MKRLILGLVMLISFNTYSQVSDSTDIYDINYNKIKRTINNKVFPTLDSLYNIDSNLYKSFYLINNKDTIFARRKETYLKTYKVYNGERV